MYAAWTDPAQLKAWWCPRAGFAEPEITLDLRVGERSRAGQGSELLLTHHRFADVAVRDRHQQGWNGCIASLDQYLSPYNPTTPRRFAMANPFVHVELSTTDVGKAKTFYAQLFDWKLEDMKMATGEYTMIDTGGDHGGGIKQQPMPGAPSMWMAYVLVDDIDALVTKTKALGGTVCKDKMEVPGMGWLAIIVDPTGAMLGMWKPMM